jgi:DNA replicative helicase MCM subunit Mcm2 (Cdc46/Mcm family)
MNDFVDQTIVCKDCGAEFIWSASGQRFFKEKGYTQPMRCRSCREKKRERTAQMRNQ